MCSYVLGPFLGAVCVGAVAGFLVATQWGWNFWVGAIPVFLVALVLGMWASLKMFMREADHE